MISKQQVTFILIDISAKFWTESETIIRLCVCVGGGGGGGRGDQMVIGHDVKKCCNI